MKTKTEFNKNIGLKLKKIRRSLGFTQKELGEKLGITTYAQIMNYETGRSQISLETLNKICDIFKIGSGYFFENKEVEKINVLKIKENLDKVEENIDVIKKYLGDL